MKFKRIRAGKYATQDGKYEVERDTTGYVPVALREGTGVEECGTDDDGWCLVIDGQVYDWFDTKREAVDCAQRLASLPPLRLPEGR